MIGRLTSPLRAALALMAAGTAAAQPPVPAPIPSPPGARWIVDESGDTCVMGRQLAAGPDVTLAVRTYPGSGNYDLRFVRADWISALTEIGEQFELRLAPTSTAYSRPRGAVLLNAGTAQALRFGGLGDQFLTAFAQSNVLTVHNGGDVMAAYALPQAAAVAAAFADCEAAKLIDWGADPAAFEPGGRRARPIGDETEWLTGLVPEGAEGTFRIYVRLSLGADGRPTDCVVLDASAANLRTNACTRFLEHARYEPARDPRRNPVRSVAVTGSEWSIVRRVEGTQIRSN